MNFFKFWPSLAFRFGLALHATSCTCSKSSCIFSGMGSRSKIGAVYLTFTAVQSGASCLDLVSAARISRFEQLPSLQLETVPRQAGFHQAVRHLQEASSSHHPHTSNQNDIVVQVIGVLRDSIATSHFGPFLTRGNPGPCMLAHKTSSPRMYSSVIDLGDEHIHFQGVKPQSRVHQRLLQYRDGLSGRHTQNILLILLPLGLSCDYLKPGDGHRRPSVDNGTACLV